MRSATKVTAELLAAAGRLKVVGRAGIGVDNIDVDAATLRGVLVVNAPTANLMSATEHTLALLLAVARRVPEADASTKGGGWNRKLTGIELQGKTCSASPASGASASASRRAPAPSTCRSSPTIRTSTRRRPSGLRLSCRRSTPQGGLRMR